MGWLGKCTKLIVLFCEQLENEAMGLHLVGRFVVDPIYWAPVKIITLNKTKCILLGYVRKCT